MVTNLRHVALSVPDPIVGMDFYDDLGLDGNVDGNRVVIRCPGRDQDQVVLTEGPKRRLTHICLGSSAERFGALQARVEAETPLIDPPKDAPSGGIWCRDPDGIDINLVVADPAPSLGGPTTKEPVPAPAVNYPGHFARIGERAAPPRGQRNSPRRLGHMLQFTADMKNKIRFYTDVLGFKLADRVGDVLAWLYCEGGSDHHVMAFASSDAPGLHHLSFEMGCLDEVGQTGMQMLEKGHRDGWGLGRHVIGSNYFHYIRDPWMGLAELYCDMDYIPDGMAWQARDWPAEDSLYAWGPDVPGEFVTNFEKG